MARYNSKLTSEVCSKICEALSKGHSIKGACAYADISEVTYHNWYNRGKTAKSGRYKQFVCDVDNAKSKATYDVEDVILYAIPSDVATAKWWLVKHNPDLYGDRTFTEAKVEADVKTELLTKLERPLPELEDDDECT
jgi:hypothetical protein